MNQPSKPAILFLASRLPYPPIGGDRLKNHSLLGILARRYRVHLVALTDRPVPDAFRTWADDIGLSYRLFYKPRWKSYLHTLYGLFFNRRPLQVNYYHFKDVARYVADTAPQFDLIFATLIRTAPYAMPLSQPKIIDMADAIGLNYLKARKASRSWFWKLIYSIEDERLMAYEKECIRAFDRILLFNKEEARYFHSPSVVWVPHGVNERLLTYEKKDPAYARAVTFFGKMDYQPNIDAVLWFSKQVLPHLHPALRFVIAGASPTRQVRRLARDPRIEVTGFVDDPYALLKGSLCTVAPMQTGGGIQNKVLETMALGTINIVSPLAARGIGAEHGRHWFVIDDPREMASTINKIFRTPERFQPMGEAARTFIRRHFTWKIYGEKIYHIIDQLLEEQPSRPKK